MLDSLPLVDPGPQITLASSTPRLLRLQTPGLPSAHGLTTSAWNALRCGTLCPYPNYYVLIRGRFQQLAADVERILVNTSISPNESQNFVRQVLQIAGRSSERDETALAFSQKTVQLLFKTGTQAGRELYVALLTKMCEAWPKVAKEAIDWLLFAEDEVSVRSLTIVPRTDNTV